MSAIIHLMGGVTKDPVMQQGRNNGTEYISMDLATSQRSQNPQNNPENQYESVFYQCFLNKHLAERLLKAGVKKGTCLYVYGELELHPFVYSQGQRSGQASSGAKINVRDWQFCLSNKPENEPGANPAGGPAAYNGGAATPGAGGYQNQNNSGGNYQNTGGTAQGGSYPNGSTPQNGGYPNGNSAAQGGNYSANGAAQGGNYAANGTAQGGNYSVNGAAQGGNAPTGGTAQNGSYQPGAPAQNQFNGNQMQLMTGNTQYGQTSQGSFAGDGFTNIPESMAMKLPFTA